MGMNNSNRKTASVRDFIDAADVRGIYLYRKDGCVLSYIRIYPYNLNLKGRDERKAETDRLSAAFKDDRKDFTYFTLPREIDLDKYKSFLKERHSQEMDLGRRRLLAVMLQQCAYLTTSGENFEHQHFIKIWKKSANRAAAEEELKERINEFRIRYENAGIHSEVLPEPEIIKLCNLFGNSLQAGFEGVDDSSLYSPVMQL